MKPDLIILKSPEILLKGAPVRIRFEAQLIRNIRAALEENKISFEIRKTQARFLIYTKQIEKALDVLKRIFGISVMSPAVETQTDLEQIKQTALKISNLDKTKSFAVRAKRATKEFRLDSRQINEQVGEYILKQTGAKVNLTKPDVEINIEVIGKRTLIFTKAIRSYGGLPVGTQGKIVCLMSGGMDSPVAAWMMLKRGCEIIPLHMKVSETEYKRFLQLIKHLQNFSIGHEIKPQVLEWNSVLEKLTKKLKQQNKLSWTCLFCKHQMLLEAEKLANKTGAKAVVIGSSLGQVASQTLDNVAVTHYGIKLPILTPLIGFNKEETEKIAREIGTYEISQKSAGKAICTFLPSKPCTAATLKKFEEVLSKLK